MAEDVPHEELEAQRAGPVGLEDRRLCDGAIAAATQRAKIAGPWAVSVQAASDTLAQERKRAARAPEDLAAARAVFFLVFCACRAFS